jgi:hypothetical protein
LAGRGKLWTSYCSHAQGSKTSNQDGLMTKRPLSPPKATANPIQSSSEDSRARPEKKSTNSKRLAKSNDPAFMKFTTYIRKSTHRGVKTRLVSKEKELSDLVEELLFNWLKENDSFSV